VFSQRGGHYPSFIFLFDMCVRVDMLSEAQKDVNVDKMLQVAFSEKLAILKMNKVVRFNLTLNFPVEMDTLKK